MSYLDKVKGISEELSNKLTVIMGYPGSGKTSLAGTYPKPMLYVTIGDDGGGVVLKQYSDNDVKVIEIKTDTTTSVSKVKELLKELKENPKHGYKTIVFDAWTSLQEELEQFARNKKGTNLNFDEWASIGKELLDCRDKVVDLSKTQDCEFVLVCHVKDKEETDNLTNEITKSIIPKMTGTNGKILLERANNVMYCCRKNVKDENGRMSVKFLTYIGAHPSIDTKLRTDKKLFDGVGTYIENCTYEKIQELIDGKLNEKIEVIENVKNPFETKDGNEQW